MTLIPLSFWNGRDRRYDSFITPPSDGSRIQVVNLVSRMMSKNRCRLHGLSTLSIVFPVRRVTDCVPSGKWSAALYVVRWWDSQILAAASEQNATCNKVTMQQCNQCHLATDGRIQWMDNWSAVVTSLFQRLQYKLADCQPNYSHVPHAWVFPLQNVAGSFV